MPERIQLRRTKGWRLPDGAVSVARPTSWGNPFRVGDQYQINHERGVVRDRAHAVELYRRTLPSRPHIADEARRGLAGRDLACWCPPGEPCHADVLLEVANVREVCRG